MWGEVSLKSSFYNSQQRAKQHHKRLTSALRFFHCCCFHLLFHLWDLTIIFYMFLYLHYCLPADDWPSSLNCVYRESTNFCSNSKGYNRCSKIITNNIKIVVIVVATITTTTRSRTTTHDEKPHRGMSTKTTVKRYTIIHTVHIRTMRGDIWWEDEEQTTTTLSGVINLNISSQTIFTHSSTLSCLG